VINNVDSSMSDSVSATPPTIIVHSMGKVGSSAIHDALAECIDHSNADVEILHTHQLNLRTIKFLAAKFDKPVYHLVDAQRFMEQFERPHVTLISPVREPISRNISAFFTNALQYGFPRDLADVKVDALMDTFINRYPHSIPSRWFDEQIREVFNIDVFAKPLDFSSGGCVIQNEQATLLLLRSEDRNDLRETKIRSVTQLQSFTLERVNAADAKTYSDVYSAFKQQFRPPLGFLEEMYETRFAKHFYTAGELTGFKRAWMKPSLR
jgi:hypothetical protein